VSHFLHGKGIIKLLMVEIFARFYASRPWSVLVVGQFFHAAGLHGMVVAVQSAAKYKPAAEPSKVGRHHTASAVQPIFDLHAIQRVCILPD